MTKLLISTSDTKSCHQGTCHNNGTCVNLFNVTNDICQCPNGFKPPFCLNGIYLSIYLSITRKRGRRGLVVNTSDSGSRGRGFEPHSGRRVVSLSKTYLPPKSTGNTQEAVAPSQHD